MSSATPEPVRLVRQFNRFYTHRIGVLRERLLDSRFSLTEVRVLYELAHREAVTAGQLGAELGLDAGYLSRMLGSFERARLITRTRSDQDRRQVQLGLTARGRAAFAELDARQERDVAALLAPLSDAQRRRLVAAMDAVERLLGARDPATEPYRLRPPRPGDLGWIVHRHGALYAEEYGWDEQFEALVAQVVGEYVRDHDPRRERCWIAERDGDVVGSVFVVAKSATIAKLRLLYVEPDARGLGIGKRLIDECIGYARAVGYRKITLWTQRNLAAARHLYRAAGFHRAGSNKHHSFGRDLVAETWDLSL